MKIILVTVLMLGGCSSLPTMSNDLINGREETQPSEPTVRHHWHGDHVIDGTGPHGHWN